MKKDNVGLVCDIAELSSLFEQTSSLQEFLQKVVSVVAWHMKAAVCSIYLVDPDTQELVLTVNQGLNPEAVGRVRLRSGEGIIGRVMQTLQPVCEARCRNSPYFKRVPGLDEERYEAFLAVAITRNLTCVGVLAVQDPQPDYFDDNDTKALRAIAAQLANVIENTRLLMSLSRGQVAGPPKREETPLSALRFIHATPGSAGVALSRALVIGTRDTSLLAPAPEDAGDYTIEDFHRAVQQTRDQLTSLQRHVEERLADVASLIFSAHLLILKDDAFSGAMIRRIEQGVAPPVAVVETVNEFLHLFSTSPYPQLQEKAQDVKDLGHRLLHNLLSTTAEDTDYNDRVVIAGDLMPSDIVKLVVQRAAALVLVGSGVTAHVSILARSLHLPMVIANDRRLFQIPDGTTVLIDANQGSVCVEPSKEVLGHYRSLMEAQRGIEEMAAEVEPETFTRDGQRVRLLANINLLSELDVAERLKAEGVGLYRSEFPFLVRNAFPSEEEQYRIYRAVADRMGDREVVFRTLDIGGDKMLSYCPIKDQVNPFLGLRAVRFSLRRPDVFSQQLRALLRAGAARPLRILFPLISSVDEFLQVRAVVLDCIEALRNEDIPHNANPLLGAMVELPAAVEVIDELAQVSDFLSVGSNDLVQYTLAVDRTNAQVADLYLPHHPAVLRSLNRVTEAARRYRKPVCLCGEIACDPRMLPFLLGIGLRALSMDSRSLPAVQKFVSTVDVLEAEAFAKTLLSLSRITDVVAVMKGRSAVLG